MKKVLPILYIIIALFASCKKDDSGDVKGPVTRDQAIKIAKPYIDAADVAAIYANIIPAETDLSALPAHMHDIISPSYDAWIVIIIPNVSTESITPEWLICIEVETGKIEIIKDVNVNISNYKTIILKQANKLSSKEKEVRIGTKSGTPSNLNNYAIIISGGGNADNNFYRYYNNSALIYNVLTGVYGYSKSHIKLLFANGINNSNGMNYGTDPLFPILNDYPLDFDGDGLCDIDYSATSSNLYSVFASLSNTLTEGDNLFIFVTDHGDRLYDTSYICLWGENISSYSFASLVDMIPSSVKIQILLGQCYSGGFVSDLSANNRVIATACSAYEGALATSDYSTFLKSAILSL